MSKRLSWPWRFIVLFLVALGSPTRAQDTCAGDGIVLGDPGSSPIVNAVVIDSGSLYLAGYDSVPGNGEWHVEKRSLGDCALDASFGTGGVSRSNPTFNWDVPYAIAVGAGHLYAAGMDGLLGIGNDQWRIEKRGTSSGALVGGFGLGGVVTAGGGQAQAALTDGTHLYVVGDSSFQWRIEKRSVADGAPVAGFGVLGTITGAPGAAYGAALAGGALYVVGSDGSSSWRFEKRDAATGALLYAVTESFADVGCGPQGAFAVALDGSFLYAAGEASGQWRIEKRQLSDGALVYSQTLPGSGSCDAPKGVAIDGSAMYVAGYVSHRWRIEKRSLATGLLVPGFGSGGVVTSGGFFSEANAIAIDASRMYVAGYESIGGANYVMRLEMRCLSDGSFGGCLAPTTTTTTSSTTTTLPVACQTPLSLSDCRLRVGFGSPASDDRFSIRCRVTLDPGSDGIDPAAEGIRLLLGDGDSPLCGGSCLSTTVVPTRSGRCWRYVSPSPQSPGLRMLKLCSVDPTAGTFRLVARSRRADLGCLNRAPYAVGLSVGDDCAPPCGSSGETTSTATSSTTSTSLAPGCQSVTASPNVVVNAAPQTEDWFSPADAAVEDGSTAFVRLVFGTPSSFLAASGFGFALPPTVLVRGITLTLTRLARDPGTIFDHSIRLMKGGSVRAVDRSRLESWTPAYTAVTYGGPSDLWGEAWTPADVNGPGFGAAIGTQYSFFAGNNDAGVDAMRITVDYCQ
jgi:hypothetical protein